MDNGWTEEVEVVFGPEVQRGPQEPCLVGLKGESRGLLYRLPQGDTLVGRERSLAQLVLSAAGVSRAHARLFHHEDGRVTVSDLGSTNGTFVNGEKVEEKELRDGDTVSFGPNALMRLDFQDTVEQKLLTNLYDSATRDPLTGVLNKKCFEERFHGFYGLACRTGAQACLAMVDADRFKSVNDTYGHPAGDVVLKELARRFLEITRDSDVVARYGGEEFVFLLRDIDLESAAVILDRVREAIENEPFTVPMNNGESQDIEVTVSVGVALITPDQDMEAILAAADSALYRAKEGGRNRVETAPSP